MMYERNAYRRRGERIWGMRACWCDTYLLLRVGMVWLGETMLQPSICLLLLVLVLYFIIGGNVYVFHWEESVELLFLVFLFLFLLTSEASFLVFASNIPWDLMGSHTILFLLLLHLSCIYLFIPIGWSPQTPPFTEGRNGNPDRQVQVHQDCADVAVRGER